MFFKLFLHIIDYIAMGFLVLLAFRLSLAIVIKSPGLSLLFPISMIISFILSILFFAKLGSILDSKSGLFKVSIHLAVLISVLALWLISDDLLIMIDPNIEIIP